MKRPTLRVLEYRHSKTHPWCLDLRPFNKGQKFFKFKAEAEGLRQIATLNRHGEEAVGLAPAELSAIHSGARKKLAKDGDIGAGCSETLWWSSQTALARSTTKSGYQWRRREKRITDA